MTTNAIRLGLTLIIVTLSSTLIAQQPRSLRPDEYRRWEQLTAQRTPISPDGAVAGVRHQARRFSNRAAGARRRRRRAGDHPRRRATGVFRRLAVDGLPHWLHRRTGSQTAEREKAAPQ